MDLIHAKRRASAILALALRRLMGDRVWDVKRVPNLSPNLPLGVGLNRPTTSDGMAFFRNLRENDRNLIIYSSLSGGQRVGLYQQLPAAKPGILAA